MKPTRPYSRHGLNVLKARVKVRGLGAIDRRTAAGRALVAWREDLLRDLGGPPAVSVQRHALADLATRTKLYVDSLDAWLMAQPSLVNGRRKAVLPVLRERQALADSLARILGQLGLERREKPAPSLRQYLEARSREAEAPTSAQEPRSLEATPDSPSASPIATGAGNSEASTSTSESSAVRPFQQPETALDGPFCEPGTTIGKSDGPGAVAAADRGAGGAPA